MYITCTCPLKIIMQNRITVKACEIKVRLDIIVEVVMLKVLIFYVWIMGVTLHKT